MTTLNTLAAAAPPAPTAPPFVNSGAIIGFLSFLVIVVLIWQGLRLMMKADKNKVAQSMSVGANMSIGLVFVALGIIGGVITIAIGAVNFFVK